MATIDRRACGQPGTLRVDMAESGVTFFMDGADELVYGSFEGPMELGMGFSTLFVVFGVRVCEGPWAFCPYHVALDGGGAAPGAWIGCVPLRVVARGRTGAEKCLYRGILPKGFSNALLEALKRQETQEGLEERRLADLSCMLRGLDESNVPMRAVQRMAAHMGRGPSAEGAVSRSVRIVRPRCSPVCS